MAKPPEEKPGIVLLQALIIVVAGFLIYSPAFHGGWIWDDLRFIPQNPLLDDPARLWKIWFQPSAFIEYYPIEATVQWAEWILWGNNTLGYHLVNVVLHLTSAFLVWRLLAKIGLGVRCAGLAAILFTVHPIMVESVAWMVELKNTLSLPPLLLAMIIYLDYDEHRRPRTYALAWLLFLAAMLCKTSVMMLPFIILLHAWWKRNRIDPHDLRAASGFLVSTLALGAVNLWINHLNGWQSGAVVPASILHRLFAIGWFAFFYIFKTLLPFHLLPVYPAGFVPSHGALLVAPTLLLGGLIAWAWIKRDTWGRAVLLGLGFYLINLAPMAAFIVMNYSTMVWTMDHNVYISMMGPCGLAAAGFGLLQHRLPGLASALAIGVVVLLSLVSCSHASLFVDRKTLWTYTIQYFPNAVPALTDLSIIALQEGDGDRSAAYARRAAELAPESDVPYINLGNALMKLNRFPEADEAYAHAVKLNPKNAAAHAAVASSLARKGDYPGALRDIDEALRLQPDLASAFAARGEIKRSLGDLTGALRDLDRAVALDPQNGSPHVSRGIIRQSNGDLSGALTDLRSFRQLSPTDANADYAALWIWIIERRQGHAADADHDLTAALAQAWNAAPTDAVTRHALFLLGSTTEAAYLAAQPNESGRQCEARYYAGVKRLLAGDKPGAATDFRASLATGNKDFFEYNLAQGELNALAAH
jgi:tetratricopeptide (TPR) repeat protein